MLKRDRILQKKHRSKNSLKIKDCYFSVLQVVVLGIFFASLPFQEEKCA